MVDNLQTKNNYQNKIFDMKNLTTTFSDKFEATVTNECKQHVHKNMEIPTLNENMKKTFRFNLARNSWK